MKKLLFFPLLFVTILGYAQSIEGLIQIQYEPKEEFADGHPYLFEEFNSSTLKTTLGNQQDVMIRYNLAENNLLASLNGKEYILKKDMIEAFTLSNTDGKKYTFIPLRIGTRQYFVEELFSGHSIKFVKWHRKQFKKGQPQPSYTAQGNSPDLFEEIFTYLFVVDGQAIEYTKKKEDLVGLLAKDNADLKASLLDKMKKEKLKAKDEGDVVALLQYCEELLKK